MLRARVRAKAAGELGVEQLTEAETLLQRDFVGILEYFRTDLQVGGEQGRAGQSGCASWCSSCY